MRRDDVHAVRQPIVNSDIQFQGVGSIAARARDRQHRRHRKPIRFPTTTVFETVSFPCAGGTGGHEVDLPAPFTGGSVHPVDSVPLIWFELQPPLGRPADVIPDTFHGFGARPRPTAFERSVPGATLEFCRRLTEALVEVRYVAIDIDPQSRMSLPRAVRFVVVWPRSIGRTAIAAMPAAA